MLISTSSRRWFRHFRPVGTQIGERMKGEGVENITAVQALVKRLSEAKDFQEALAVQTAFILFPA
jgi:hypothetical protein